MTLARRLITAVRKRTLRRGVGLRLRQFAFANTHDADHYLKLRDARRRFTAGQVRRVVRRITEQPMSFSIDVVSTCNLACPTCPVANWPKESWTGVKGIMDAALLHRLIRKAVSECIVGDVRLFAYTEPLLHPRLHELVAVVKSYRLPCGISTNLNVLRDADALLAAGPDQIVVSVSGFYQENYAVTHAGGDIEVVKKHMRTLAEVRKRIGAKTDIRVSFHKYRTNLGDVALMKQFAASLGFGFDESWAVFFPLEKVLTYARPDLAMATITDADVSIIDRLGVSLKELVDRAARTPAESCELQDHAVILDVTGQVYLCCESAMDASRNRIASYLDTPLELVQARKNNHSLCTTCMSGGLPLLGASR